MIAGQEGFSVDDYRCLTYKAAGDGWSLMIEGGQVHFREQAGQARFDYHGPLPPKQAIENGVRYEGELLHLYAVASLAEEDSRRYALMIVERPCTDRRGRNWPTSVTFDFNPDYRIVGCGSHIPFAP